MAHHVSSLNNALVRAEQHAPYLRLLMKQFPDTVALLADAEIEQACAASINPELPVPQALRIAKRRLSLALAIGDLAGVLSLEHVTNSLSDFADLAFDTAIREAFKLIIPGAEVRGLAALALGKHGSRELNYSSDIDPILIFDPHTLPCRARDEPIETALRIAQKAIEILQTHDSNGYVFRVDMRLRPSPEATPLVLPVNAAISYYESSALHWERIAFIRARACAGDRELGAQFLETIRPFIWRRGLDFGVVQELSSVSHRIRDHFHTGQIFGPGYNLKLGRGGIRECEFYVQIHQLIHGGRNVLLRDSAIRPALAALTKAGWIAEEHSLTLDKSYHLLRMIEHRLQMVDDQQTHSLPTDPAALDNVARLHGLKRGDDLLELLVPSVTRASAIYDEIDAPIASMLPIDVSHLQKAVSQIGFKQSVDVAKRILAWRSGKYRSLRSSNAHEALESVLPILLAAFEQAADPMRVVNRFDQLLERLPSAVNLFLLLNAQPSLRNILCQILCHAPTLADDLARRPDLLDGLIDASALEHVGSVAELIPRLRHYDPSADLELQLDYVRRLVGELRFALGVQIIAGTSDPLDAATGYARVAEAAVHVAAQATIAHFEATHGVVPDSELAIIALGRMGGEELTHRSDLDLVFVFTGDYRAESDGIKPLGAMHYYNRLTQRVISSLSVPTANGPLYEIDTRLRPSGARGELCVSLAGFADYQTNEAWTWEHMALTRARVIYGSGKARLAIQSVIDAILKTPHEAKKVVADAVEMRALISDHKPPATPLDVKLVDGGLVDLEFCVQIVQLQTGTALTPQLAMALNMMDPTGKLETARQLMTRFLLAMRLVSPELKPPPAPTKMLVANACGTKDWASLMRQLKASHKYVSAEWTKISEAAAQLK